MSSIASIDTNIYSGLIESNQASSGRNAPEVAKTPTFSSSEVENSQVDLSNYYSNIRPEDLYADMGANVQKTAQDLDNAMVSALKNGYGVNDICNIKMAQHAYKASAAVFKASIEMTNFELSI